jgi:hypothetical protein
MSRIIQARIRSSAVQTADMIASLFALELLHPSKQLFLGAPLLRNSPILPNGLRQFSSLLLETEAGSLSLAASLALLAERGTSVCLMLGGARPSSEEFLTLLPPPIETRMATPLHFRGLCSEHFCLRGTLRFSSDGIDVGDDQLELITEPELVNRLLLEVTQYWEDLQ